MRTTMVVAAAGLVAAGLTGLTPAVADAPTCLGQPVTIAGTSGDDTIHGTSGNDVIFAGQGNDYVYGHEGDDLICLAEPGDPIVVPEYVDDGDDTNDPHFSDNAFGGPGNDQIVSGVGATFVKGGWGADEIWSIADAEFNADDTGCALYRGGPDDDVLHGNESPECMSGGWGDDVLHLGDATGIAEPDGADIGDNFARGGPGDDIVIGGSARDFIVGGRGNDRLEGHGAVDRLYGDPRHYGFADAWFGDDELNGGPGDDLLFGMGGRNAIDGGSGTDACLDPSDGPRAAGCEGLAELPDQRTPPALPVAPTPPSG